MQTHPESDGDKVPGLYHHKAGALGTPARPGNVMMYYSVFLKNVFEAMICNFIVAHFLSVGLLYWLAFIAMSCLQTCIQYSLRLSLPAHTRHK